MFTDSTERRDRAGDRRPVARASAAVAGLAAALVVAGCGGSSQPSAANSTAPTAVETSAPTHDTSPAGAQAKVTAGGFIFGLRLESVPQLTTTVTEGAQTFDAPPGKKFLTVAVAVTNVTSQQEPLGLELTSTTTTLIAFGVPLAETAAFGEAPGANHQCVESNFSDDLPTGLCALATTTDSISPGSDILGAPEMSPGATQHVVVFFGPMDANAPVADARVYAIGDNPPAVRIT